MLRPVCLDAQMSSEQIACRLGWKRVGLARDYVRGVDAILNGNTDFSTSPAQAGKVAAKVRTLMRHDTG